MKEIIIVTNYMTNGGAQRVLSELANEWALMGNQVSIVQATPSLALNNSYRLDKNIKIINLSTHSFFITDFIAKTIELYRIIKQKKNSIVINFTNITLLYVGICSLLLDNKFIFSERNYPKKCPHSPLKRLFRNIIFHFADICVFQTNEAKEYFSKKISENSVIIPNPINVNLPERYCGERRKAICAIGRLNKQKNYTMLIDAFARVSNIYHDYCLEIYGRGEDEDKIRFQIKKYGLENKIFLMGFSEDIFRVTRNCSLYVSSSDYEGISNSMLEALGMGLPVVVTDCPAGGAKMVINNGFNGILVPVGDDIALADAICCVLSDNELAERLGTEATKIKQKYNIVNIAKQWLEIM